MHTLVAILLSTLLNIGQHAPDREHHEIFIVTGQSNARAMYADGVMMGLRESRLWNNPVLYHRHRSGEGMFRWVTGTDGDYAPGSLFLADFDNHFNTSGLEHLIRSIREQGDTYEIAGFFWFQGESDSGFTNEVFAYSGRFRFLLDQIAERHNWGRPIPFVITIVDHNTEFQDQLPGSVSLFEFMRGVQFAIAEDDPNGIAFDSRGWPRLDLWHVGDRDHISGQYGPVRDMGYEQALAFADAFGPPPCPADLSLPYRVLDELDVEHFYRAFKSENPIADFVEDGVFDFQDVKAFFDAYAQGCKDS